MTQTAVFTNDAQTLQPLTAAPTIGLDWARVAQEAGCPSANQIFSNPFQPLNNCSGVPEVNTSQLFPGIHAPKPFPVHSPEAQPVVPTPEETHHSIFKDWHTIKEEFSTPGYLMNDAWFGLLRDSSYAGSFIAKGKLSQLPYKQWTGIGTIVTAELVDDGLDGTAFKGVKRGLPSTLTDLAANAIFFLPQSGVIKGAEMIGMHVLGKEIEKHFYSSK